MQDSPPRHRLCWYNMHCSAKICTHGQLPTTYHPSSSLADASSWSSPDSFLSVHCFIIVWILGFFLYLCLFICAYLGTYSYQPSQTFSFGGHVYSTCRVTNFLSGQPGTVGHKNSQGFGDEATREIFGIRSPPHWCTHRMLCAPAHPLRAPVRSCGRQVYWLYGSYNGRR